MRYISQEHRFLTRNTRRVLALSRSKKRKAFKKNSICKALIEGFRFSIALMQLRVQVIEMSKLMHQIDRAGLAAVSETGPETILRRDGNIVDVKSQNQVNL